MSKDSPALGPILRQDEQPADGRRPPSEWSSDAASQAELLVELPEGRLERCELALDLDHEEACRSRVPGEEIHRAALAELGIRDLGGDDPADRLEPGSAGSENPGVALVDQAVVISPQAANRRLIAQPEDRNDGPDRSGAHRPDAARPRASTTASGPLPRVRQDRPGATAGGGAELEPAVPGEHRPCGQHRETESPVGYPGPRRALTKLELSRAYGRKTGDSRGPVPARRTTLCVEFGCPGQLARSMGSKSTISSTLLAIWQ